MHSVVYAATPLKILATIPPLAFVAQDIAGDTAVVEILLPEGSSPHHYQLKPSDRIKIANADLMLWLGKDAENYLARALTHSTPHQKSLAILDTPEIKPFLGEHAELDIHVWLDPTIMSLWAQQLADYLGEKNPQKAHLFQQRADQLKKQLLKKSQPTSLVPIIEVADAFGYLHRALAIKPLLILNNHEDRMPSLQQRILLQRIIQQHPKTCVIITPEQTEKDMRHLLNNSSPIILRLDPLGYDALSKPQTRLHYVDFFQRLAKNYLLCAH